MEPENQNGETNNTETVCAMAAPETEPKTEEADELKEHKTFAILGYIIPLLFFLPLLDEKTKSVPFARFHANQQLIVLILFVALQFLYSTVLMMLSSLGYMLMSLASMTIFILALWGAFHAYKGNTKELPFVGHFKILK